MKLRSSSGTGEVKQSGMKYPLHTSTDNTKSFLLSLVIGHHLDQYGNHELLRLILQPLSYWKCKFPCPAKIPLIQEKTEKLLLNFATLSVATLRKLLWTSSLSQIMQHWTSQQFPRDIPVDLIFLGALCAQECATVSVAPTGFFV